MEELGEILRAARKKAGITLDEIAARTKIHRRHLEAMEAGAFHRLPGMVYARAFLKHYARNVGLDPAEVLEQFELAIEREKIAASSSRRGKSGSRRKTKRRRRTAHVAWQWIGAAVLLVVLGFGVSSILGDRTTEQPENPIASGALTPPEPSGTSNGVSDDGFADIPAAPSTRGSAYQDKTPPAEAREARQDEATIFDSGIRETGLDEAGDPAPGIDGGTLFDPGPSRQPGSERTIGTAEDAGTSNVSQSQAGAGDSDGFGQTMPEEAIGAQGVRTLAVSPPSHVGEAPAEAGSVSPVEEPGDFGVVLDVEVLRTCWFNVVADGEPLFEGVLRPGEDVTWTADQVLRVRFGRPEGVRLTLNGRYLGAAGTGVITREFTAENGGTASPPLNF